MTDVILLRLLDAWRQCERHLHHLHHALAAITPLLPVSPDRVGVPSLRAQRGNPWVCPV